MNVHLVVRALPALLAIAASCLLGVQECRAGMSLADILGTNDEATLTSGGLMFTFNKATVLSSTFPQVKAPTLDTVFVTTTSSGLTFTFTPSLLVAGNKEQDYTVTLSYTVAATFGITDAGLSFAGLVPDKIMDSSNPLANSSVTEMLTNDLSLKVFKTNDMNSILSAQNDQMTALPEAMGLSVTDVGNISIPARGGLGTGYAELDSLTNTFSVPEPSSFALCSIAALAGLGVSHRGRRRSAA